MEQGWIGAGARVAEAIVANALWLAALAGGAFALALAAERVLLLAGG